MHKVICSICGTEFETKKNQKYCSKKCSLRAKNLCVKRIHEREIARAKSEAEAIKRNRTSNISAWGRNYAEMQKAETLRLIGGLKYDD